MGVEREAGGDLDGKHDSAVGYILALERRLNVSWAASTGRAKGGSDGMSAGLIRWRRLIVVRPPDLLSLSILFRALFIYIYSACNRELEVKVPVERCGDSNSATMIGVSLCNPLAIRNDAMYSNEKTAHRMTDSEHPLTCLQAAVVQCMYSANKTCK